MLVVIEGVDGSGKQTQSQMLFDRLSEKFEVRKLTFPNYEGETSALVKMYLGGQFGKKPEDVNAYASSTFYAADRIGSYLSDWKNDFEQGKFILCDRYTTSNAVHQAGKLEECFGTGTAAIISPVGELRWGDHVMTVNDNQIGEVTQRIFDTITGIQTGTMDDELDWVVCVD